jgi:hypothetical protein
MFTRAVVNYHKTGYRLSIIHHPEFYECALLDESGIVKHELTSIDDGIGGFDAAGVEQLIKDVDKLPPSATPLTFTD